MAIDPFQEDVARIALAAAGEHDFALAGGNALVAHEVLDRETEDIDLFSPEPGGPGAVVAVVRDALVQAGYTAVIIKPAEAHQGDYARLEVAGGDRVMRLDLARDWRQWPPVRLDVGPVLHLDDAAGSKTNAMVTRYLPRDFIDVAAVLARYSRSELMRLTFTRDPGLRVVDFIDAVRELDRMPDEKFYKYRLTDNDIAAVRAQFAGWPRHEADDAEGHAVHAAVAEVERQMRIEARQQSAAALAGQAYPDRPPTREGPHQTGRHQPPEGSGPDRSL